MNFYIIFSLVCLTLSAIISEKVNSFEETLARDKETIDLLFDYDSQFRRYYEPSSHYKKVHSSLVSLQEDLITTKDQIKLSLTPYEYGEISQIECQMNAICGENYIQLSSNPFKFECDQLIHIHSNSPRKNFRNDFKERLVY